MTSAYLERMDTALAGLAEAGRRRRLRPVAADSAATILRDGRRLLNFSSNDYLGLARHPLLAERAADWAHRHGTGATASRLVCGTLEAHAALEARLAALKGTEAALLFNSGFQCNEAVLSALLHPDVAGKAPAVFVDRLAHASMHAGLRAAGVRQIRFRHNDLGHLATLLSQAAPDAPRFIVTESVFSMDGDRADIAGLAALAETHGAFLYVDEAHATGVLGPHGAGLCAAPEVRGRVDLVMGTFGKALGGFGAYVACSARVRDWLVNRAGGLIYSTALPPPVLGAIDAALDLLPEMDDARRRLHAHADAVRAACAEAGLPTLESTTQIVPAVLGPEDRALAAMATLEEAGLLAVAIRPPTVPPGTSRLRLALSAAHTEAQITTLCEQLRRLA